MDIATQSVMVVVVMLFCVGSALGFHEERGVNRGGHGVKMVAAARICEHESRSFALVRAARWKTGGRTHDCISDVASAKGGRARADRGESSSGQRRW